MRHALEYPCIVSQFLTGGLSKSYEEILCIKNYPNIKAYQRISLLYHPPFSPASSGGG